VTSAELTVVANVAIATGPALLGAPRSFVLNFFICKVWISDFTYPRQTFGKWALFFMLYRNFIRWEQVEFIILSGNLLLCGSPFDTANYWKSCDFTLSFVYSLFQIVLCIYSLYAH